MRIMHASILLLSFALVASAGIAPRALAGEESSEHQPPPACSIGPLGDPEKAVSMLAAACEGAGGDPAGELPPTCTTGGAAGCGPNMPCEAPDAGCYLFDGLFMCCQASPLGGGGEGSPPPACSVGPLAHPEEALSALVAACEGAGGGPPGELPYTCTAGNCGPSQPCPLSNTACYLFDGEFMCCQISPFCNGNGGG